MWLFVDSPLRYTKHQRLSNHYRALRLVEAWETNTPISAPVFRVRSCLFRFDIRSNNQLTSAEFGHLNFSTFYPLVVMAPSTKRIGFSLPVRRQCSLVIVRCHIQETMSTGHENQIRTSPSSSYISIASFVHCRLAVCAKPLSVIRFHWIDRETLAAETNPFLFFFLLFFTKEVEDIRQIHKNPINIHSQVFFSFGEIREKSINKRTGSTKANCFFAKELFSFVLFQNKYIVMYVYI